MQIKMLAAIAVFSSVLFADSLACTNELNTVIPQYQTFATNRPSYIVQTPEQIRALCAAGEVCRVIGHIWQSTPHVTLEYRPSGNYPEHRKCVLCWKSETKEPSVWK